jgi:hypothetical protein
MRTTLIIDDDVLFLARDLAKAQHKSLSAVISELARDGFLARRHERGAQRSEAPAGRLPQLPSRGGVVTNQQVNALRDSLGI